MANVLATAIILAMMGSHALLPLETLALEANGDINPPDQTHSPHAPDNESDQHYRGEQFGIEFNYPAGYVMTAEVGTLDEGAIVLLRTEDLWTVEPPLIHLSFFKNSPQVSLQTFRDDTLRLQVTQDYPTTTVASQPALDFDATGYYESREQLFATPDGRHIVLVSASYLGADTDYEPLVDAAQLIRESWIWLGLDEDSP